MSNTHNKSPFLLGLFCGSLAATSAADAALLDLSHTPLFLQETGAPPITLLTMGRNHKMGYEAYNDASDLDADGDLDVGYKPADIDYFGYFDSYKCYSYNSGVFEPASDTADKTCSGGWSGDFLNYVTMSRADALRAVLFGGKRVVDTTSRTVLQRSYIPQDAHSWGKEYASIARDGYDISDYTPLSQPAADRYHLFANVTIGDPGDPPLMRVLNDTRFRVWEWVSIERPVAGSRCEHGGSGPSCESAGASASWEIVPSSDNLTRTGLYGLETAVYDTNGYSGDATPDNATELHDMLNFVQSDNRRLCGTVNPVNIDQDGIPIDTGWCSNNNSDYYLTLTKGQFYVAPGDGDTYSFGVNGDDALEFSIINDSNQATWYGGHGQGVGNIGNAGAGGSGNYTLNINLSPGLYDIVYIHQEAAGGDSYELRWNIGATPASRIADYRVNVEVCKAGMLEDNCKAYEDSGGNITYKPTGVLQDFGDNESMWFGLLTGSWAKNTAGGVLRKNVGPFTDELDPDTGIFDTNVNGIVSTIEKLRIGRFRRSNNYTYPSGWITTRAINPGEAQDWGNPVAEMMYEGLRYFAGAQAPTPEFAIANSGNVDTDTLGLPVATWKDPYSSPVSNPNPNVASECANPFQLVISDINPSFDSDHLPGVDANFSVGFSGDTLGGMNVSQLGNEIASKEGDIAGRRFIGQVDSTFDTAPTPKDVTGFGNIRGLSPEEPTKQGSYYSASVGWWGKKTDLNPAPGDQKVDTFAVALASPLPRIEIPVGNDKFITMVPFAKSTDGSGISGAQGDFQPTNQIVDFYVESLTPTSGIYRINYEDVEQAADHDMDMIVRYFYRWDDAAQELTIALSSEYAAGGIDQHAGYIVSGTTADGIYLEVRDQGNNDDDDYFLDTPPGELPGGNWEDNQPLPLQATRVFKPGATPGATVMKGPLWYAAKWGGFNENYDDDPSNNNDEPDEVGEWDEDGDGNPDNYFLVTNALTLKEQLTRSFQEILSRNGRASGISLSTGVIREVDPNDPNQQLAFGTGFDSANWAGSLQANLVNSDGTIGTLQWKAHDLLDAMSPADRKMVINDPDNGAVVFDENNFGATLTAELSGIDGLLADRVDYIRGDRSLEGATFRNRGTVLGAIIHSEATVVSKPGEPYFEEGLASSYQAFRTAQDNRPLTLYAGSADGFVHAFNDEGKELWAFAPSKMVEHLHDYTDPNWVYQSGVDLTPTVRDVRTGSTSFKSVMVGGLRRGGQGYYAIDVTNQMTTTNEVTSAFMWEFTDADDADLGYSYGFPYISRTQIQTASDDPNTDEDESLYKWVAFIGNGYNSTESDGNVGSGRAVLYAVDVLDGTIIKKFELPAVSDPLGQNRPNGLGSPTAIDILDLAGTGAGDDRSDFVYAGDLFGNLWRFDVNDADPANWSIDNGGQPVFTASSDGNTPGASNYQPITVRPRARRAFAENDDDERFMFMFGTGKYIEQSDLGAGIATQSFYVVVDDPTTNATTKTRNDLELREFSEVGMAGNTVRTITTPNVNPGEAGTDTVQDGWYMDFNAEERVVNTAQFRGQNQVLFPTLLPQPDPCKPGGTSYLMLLDYRNGLPAGFHPGDGFESDAPLDFNGDGVIDDNDKYNGDNLIGLQFDDVITGVSQTVVRAAGDDQIHIATANAPDDGDLIDTSISARGLTSPRRSWRQRSDFGN